MKYMFVIQCQQVYACQQCQEVLVCQVLTGSICLLCSIRKYVLVR